MRVLVFAAVWGVVTWAYAPVDAIASYTVTLMPGVSVGPHYYYDFDFHYYYAPRSGLNNLGQAAGGALVPVGDTKRGHAVLWDPLAGIRDLAPGDRRASFAVDVNDRGQVVVNVEQYPAGHGEYRAFLWQDGAMTELGTLGGGTSYAVRLNGAGQVVGWSDGRAFVWDSRWGMRDLGTLDGIMTTYALDINDLGQVVGWTIDTQSRVRPFIWQNGVMTDISGGRWYGMAYAINNRGQVVGGYHDPVANTGGAFLWDAESGMRDLGSLGRQGTWAWDINNLGQVVGWESGEYQALQSFIWQDGVMINLDHLIEPAPVQHVVEACAINDRGQILANGVLLTPIPEPSSLAALSLALGGLGVRWMRRRRT